ncbi:MAG TPA: ABC transporter substrate-binding protein, partial [Thermomicrobiales bacterium]|nr:ABC transporter substrate-binding protein [Thermomicrobiales bacterium]
MVRLIPEFRGAIDPKSLNDINELIQARIDGGISRRQLVKRAAQIGIAAPVVGVMLHATSDMAYGQPSHGRDRTIARMQGAATKEVTGPTQPAGTPQEGGTLVTTSIDEPDTLNPWVTALVTTSDICCGVFNGLMRYDSNQQIIPDLAEEFEISTDGLIYTFKLRQGVTFHDGAAFTAKDVDATWKAIMNPDFTAYSQLGWDHIKTIDMPDDFTVVLNTTEVYAPFMAYISDPVSAAIVSGPVLDKGPDYFRGDFGRKPIGTGPFKVDEWKAKEQVSLSRYDGYWGTKPKLEKIIYRVNPDDNTQLVQLQTGEAQMAASDGAIGSARLDEVLGFGTVDVYERPNMAWSHLDLKHVDFLRITKVRQALDYATPTQQIIDSIMKGRVVRAFADQAPITTVYATDITPRPYDLEKAKQLLTEAGLTQNGDGVWEGPTPTPSKDIDPNTDRGGPTKEFKMEFWHLTGDSTTQQIAQVISQSWNSIGIKTETKSEDVSTIWGPDGYQFDPDTMTACMYSWFNSNDPDNMYYWHSSQIPPDPTGAGGNAIAYFFPLNFQAKVDELTVAGTKETDPDKRKDIYIQLQHLIA